MPGMWLELERIFSQDGITIGHSCPSGGLSLFAHRLQDKSTSFYVGDAAGRADDFASTDRKFALNVGVQFYTPEVGLTPIVDWLRIMNNNLRNISSRSLQHRIHSQDSTFPLLRRVRVVRASRVLPGQYQSYRSSSLLGSICLTP
jgi:Polynucleotide kinase 3 phosphatase